MSIFFFILFYLFFSNVSFFFEFPSKWSQYQCQQSNGEQHGEISERLLQVCQDIAALSRRTVIEQGERQAIEEGEAMLVWVVAVVPSLLTVHPQVPLACRGQFLFNYFNQPKTQHIMISKDTLVPHNLF